MSLVKRIARAAKAVGEAWNEFWDPDINFEIACPKCGKRILVSFHGGIPPDRCRDCGAPMRVD